MSYIERLAYDREAREELQRLLDDLAAARSSRGAGDAIDALLRWVDLARAQHRAAARSQVAL